MKKLNNLLVKSNSRVSLNHHSEDTLAHRIVRRMIIILGIMLVTSLVVQFVILGTVGTIGPELSKVRREREQLELDNEIKVALIRDYQTNNGVLKSAREDFSMRGAQINRIEIKDPTSTGSVNTSNGESSIASQF